MPLAALLSVNPTKIRYLMPTTMVNDQKVKHQLFTLVRGKKAALI